MVVADADAAAVGVMVGAEEPGSLEKKGSSEKKGDVTVVVVGSPLPVVEGTLESRTEEGDAKEEVEEAFGVVVAEGIVLEDLAGDETDAIAVEEEVEAALLLEAVVVAAVGVVVVVFNGDVGIAVDGEGEGRVARLRGVVCACVCD